MLGFKFENFLNRSYLVYLFFTGIVIIVFNVYIRLFNSKKEYSLIIFKGNYFFQVIFVFFILFHIISIILNFYTLYKRFYKDNYNNSNIIQYINKIINILYWKPLEYIHDIVAPDLPYSGVIIIYINNKIETNTFFGYIAKNSYIIFGILPRLVVSFIFIYDIILLNKIKYFPYSILLLFIPILYKVYLKLADAFVNRNWPEINKYLDVTPVGEPNSHGVYLNYTFGLKKTYKPNDEILKENAYYWMLFFRLDNYILYLREHDNNIQPYINIICSSIYLLAGCYRLWYIFFV